jgi:hypothetical protein
VKTTYKIVKKLSKYKGFTAFLAQKIGWSLPEKKIRKG